MTIKNCEALFQPITIGKVEMNRIAMAPMATHFR